MLCQNCGTEITSNINFCQNCGNKIMKSDLIQNEELICDSRNVEQFAASSLEKKDKVKVALASIAVFVFMVTISNIINKFYATTFIEQSISFTFGKIGAKHYAYHFLQQIPIIFMAYPVTVMLFSTVFKLEKNKRWFVYTYTATAFIAVNALGWLFLNTKLALCLINAAMYLSVVYFSGVGNPYFKKFVDEE